MMMENMSPFGWSMGFGWLFMLMFWGLLIIGVATVVKWIFTKASGTELSGSERSAEITALEILERRYAQGEIERDEFEQKRRDLNHTL